MVTLDNSIIARYEHAGEKFELFVDPDMALLYKTGQKKDMNNLLVVDEVFKDARKGERHTEAVLKKAFQTTDVLKIAEIILAKGEVPLTTDQKKHLLQEKTKKIVNIIAREAVDPRTGAPHPAIRIERAMDEARVHVDEWRDAESQIESVLKELRPILPIKFERVRLAVRVAPEYAQRVYGLLKENGLQKEEWQTSGALIAVVEMPAGMQGDFYGRLNKATSGSAETKILK